MNKELKNVLRSIWRLEEKVFEKELPKRKEKKGVKISINDEILVIRKFFKNKE